MNIKELHDKFKDEHSPSPEAQVRWLQKQGFPQHQIDQAFILLYQDIERGQLPKVFEKRDANSIVDVKYGPHDAVVPSELHTSRDIQNGWELDQCLLECAKIVRTNELQMTLASIENFESKLKEKWKAHEDSKNQRPWYKKMFGIKPPEDVA